MNDIGQGWLGLVQTAGPCGPGKTQNKSPSRGERGREREGGREKERNRQRERNREREREGGRGGTLALFAFRRLLLFLTTHC